jgi:hypothetical protein
MSNIKNYKVILDESGAYQSGSVLPVDLFSSDGTTSKVVSIGFFDTSVTPPVQVDKKTKPTDVQYTIITDKLTDLFYVVDEPVSEVSADIEFACDFCNLDSAGANELGASCTKPMNTKDCDRDALIAMLQTQIDELVKIYGAVDGLELTTENIKIEAGQINLNTNEVESLLTQINNLIALKGSDCNNALFVKDCGTQDILDKLQEVIDALNTNSQSEQLLLSSIDTKLDELAEIKDELVIANSTLIGIKTNTDTINTNLITVIDKLDTQISALEDLKVLVTETNTELSTANTTLNTISTDVALIKSDVSTIKSDISEIKTDVKSIITKLDTIITSLTNIETKLDSIVTELQTINTTLQTEFDQTQVKLDVINTTLESSLTSFQAKDCSGADIGTPEVAQKSVILNKITTTICNVDEITDPIVDIIKTESDETQVKLDEVKEAIENKEEIDTTVSTINVCGFNQATNSYAKYIIRHTKKINNTTGVETEIQEFTSNGLNWTTTIPVDVNSNPILFTIGECPILPESKPCYENKSYEIPASKGLVFAENTLFKYGGSFFEGEGGIIEGNDISALVTHKEGDRFGNGFDSLLETLPNKVSIRCSINSNAKVSVMQICGTTPQLVDVLSGLIVTNATPNYTTNSIDVTWNDILNETSYDIYRYVTSAGATTAVKIGSVTANTTSFADTTAQVLINYTYYVVGVNSVSTTISSNATALLGVVTGSLNLAWIGTGYDTNEDLNMTFTYTP